MVGVGRVVERKWRQLYFIFLIKKRKIANYIIESDLQLKQSDTDLYICK